MNQNITILVILYIKYAQCALLKNKFNFYYGMLDN